MSRSRSFRCDAAGNVALMFALSLPLIVLTTGMAVDTANVEASKWSMQRSLDAAALGAAKEYGRTQDPATIERSAASLFFTNEGRDPNDSTRFRYEGIQRIDGSNVLRVSATRDAPTYFGSAVKAVTGGKVDLETWHLDLFSEVVVANRSIELALVLDNSGSMERSPQSGGTAKITTLREATKTLIEQMLAPQPQANAKDPVRISVVPFAASVNVGAKTPTPGWMDVAGLSASNKDDFEWGLLPPSKLALFEKLALRNPKWKWSGCVQSRPRGYAITDDAPVIANPDTLFVPFLAPSEYNWSDRALESVKNDYLKMSGSHANDVEALKAQRDAARYLTAAINPYNEKGPNSGCTTAAITPLTSAQTVALAAVKGMIADGGTNIAEGLAWGWRTLTSGQPFPEGRERNTKDNLKVIVLMTDGENTYNAGYTTGEQIELTNANRSQFGTYGYGQFLGADGKVRTGRMFDATLTTKPKAAIANITDAMNETMSRICENIKRDGTNDEGGDGIVIFSIAFDLKDGSPIKERLRACASSGIDGKGAKLYYDAKNSADLLHAFSAITDEISSLRIAR